MTERWKFGPMDLEDYGKYYYVRTYCSNCDKHDRIAVRKGVTKPDVVECQNCGCCTAKT